MALAWRWWSEWRHSQYARASLFLALGCASLVGAVLALSATLSGDSIDRLLDERIALARTAGALLEQQLESELARARRAVAGSQSDEGLGGAARVLGAGGGVVLFGQDGELIEAWPPLSAEELAVFSPATLAREAAQQGIAVSPLRPVGRVETLLLVTPRDARPDGAGGFVGLRLEPATSNLLDPLLDLYGRTSAGRVSLELVDGEGRVVAATDRRTIFREGDHGDVLASAIDEARQVRGRCHSCHEDSAGAPLSTDLMAFSPMGNLDLGVVVHQPEEEALAPAFALEQRVRKLGTGFVALFLLFAGLSVHSVVRPVTRLTRAVGRAERHDQPLPVEDFGRDEVGVLAQSLELWRRRLLESRAEVAEERAARAEEQRYLHRVLSAQEQERRRVARELHDTVAQDLAALRLQLENLASAPELPGPVRERLVRLEAQGAEVLATVRHVLLDLRLAVLEHLGFVPAVQNLLERINGEGRGQCRLVLDGEAREVPYEVAVVLLRILQESLQNALRHGGAEVVFVTVELGEGRVVLSVEDDGAGFDVDAQLARAGRGEGPSGLGLLGMRERAELLGGTLQIESAPGEGTTVHVEVPLAAPPETGGPEEEGTS